MYRATHGIGKALILAVVGLMLMGLCACGVLGTSTMAFQAGQTQGYAMGVSQASGEGVAPMPYGYHRPGVGIPFLTPLLCGGGLLLVLGMPFLLLILGAAVCAGRRRRPWRGPFGPCAPWPGGKWPEDMPDEVREYMEQHCKGGHFYPPGPWIFRHGTRHHRHGPWADEEMPDEVKQWFRQRHGRRFKGHSPQPEEPTKPSVEDAPSEVAE